MLQVKRAEPLNYAPPRGEHESLQSLAFCLGLIAVAACTVAFFWKTTAVGFLLDDHLHVGYLDAAVHGQPFELLKRMYSVWSYTTDSLSAYRPGLTLSFWLDYCLGGGQPFLMHVTNIVLTACASVAVALISNELSLAMQLKHRYVTAIGAGLLFAAYPLHPEATAWIAGRADVFSSLVYLVSVWAFLRFSRTGSRITFYSSLAAFFIGLTMKEMPATLPIVITLAAWLIYPKTRLSQIAAYWGVLFTFAALRTAVIGQVVGGYGDVGGTSIAQIVRNYCDKSTLLKLIYGATEELAVPKYLALVNYFSAGICGLFGINAAITNAQAARLFLFLLAWTAATLIPAFQIWHIYPNLVGSRMFWIGSAPLCLSLAFAALACAENFPNPGTLRLPAGLLAASGLFCTWAIVLQYNLIPWTAAGKQMSTLRAQVHALASEVADEQQVLLAGIPQDYKGVPQLGRPEFLAQLCKPPFTAGDLSSRVLTTQRPVAGGQEYIYPELFAELRQLKLPTFNWDGVAGRYYPLTYAGANEPAAWEFNAQSCGSVEWQPAPEIQSGAGWSKLTDASAVVGDDGIELHVGRKGLTFWLPSNWAQEIDGAGTASGAAGLSSAKRIHNKGAVKGLHRRSAAELLDKRGAAQRDGAGTVQSVDGIDPSAITAVAIETSYPEDFQTAGGKAPSLLWQGIQFGPSSDIPLISLPTGQQTGSAGVSPASSGGKINSEHAGRVRSQSAVELAASSIGTPGTTNDTTPPAFFQAGTFTFLPARCRTWTLEHTISRIGFAFPAGDYFVTIKRVQLLKRTPREPLLSVSVPSNTNRANWARESWLPTASPQTSVKFDCSSIMDNPDQPCIRGRIFITKAWQALPDLATSAFPNKKTIAWQADVPAISDIKLPASILQAPGIHQISIMPLGSDGEPCGILSEPRTFLVPLKQR